MNFFIEMSMCAAVVMAHAGFFVLSAERENGMTAWRVPTYAAGGIAAFAGLHEKAASLHLGSGGGYKFHRCVSARIWGTMA